MNWDKAEKELKKMRIHNSSEPKIILIIGRNTQGFWADSKNFGLFAWQDREKFQEALTRHIEGAVKKIRKVKA